MKRGTNKMAKRKAKKKKAIKKQKHKDRNKPKKANKATKKKKIAAKKRKAKKAHPRIVQTKQDAPRKGRVEETQSPSFPAGDVDDFNIDEGNGVACFDVVSASTDPETSVDVEEEAEET
jgi:hypothetical protein